MSENENENGAAETEEDQRLSNQTCLVSPTDIIREVKLRPALYLPNHVDRLNIPDYRNVLWRQIAEKLLHHWNDLDRGEQIESVIELQKKWRNIKDSYRKEVRALKQPKSPLQKYKRKYIYFNKLSFLRPIIENDVDASMQKPQRILARKRTKKTKHITNSSDEFEVYDPSSNVIPNVAESSPSINYTSIAEEIDEDKHFLLSLVPTFKRMNQDQKLSAKMDILNVLRNIQTGQYYIPENAITIRENGHSSNKRKKKELKVEVESCDSDESD